LSLNATRLSVGQGLRVNVSLWNTLSRLNLVNASDDWPFQGIPVALWPPCYATFYPAQQAAAHSANSTGAVVAVVLEGYYTMANISIAADVYFPIDCTGNWIMSNTTLQPMSSVANVTGASSVFRTNETLGPFLLSSSFTVGGYWNLLNNSQLQNTPVINAQALGPEPYPQSPEASAFVPGSYTIAIADEWGQAVILHFDVA